MHRPRQNWMCVEGSAWVTSGPALRVPFNLSCGIHGRGHEHLLSGGDQGRQFTAVVLGAQGIGVGMDGCLDLLRRQLCRRTPRSPPHGHPQSPTGPPAGHHDGVGPAADSCGRRHGRPAGSLRPPDRYASGRARQSSTAPLRTQGPCLFKMRMPACAGGRTRGGDAINLRPRRSFSARPPGPEPAQA
jgi:hypothetical protein